MRTANKLINEIAALCVARSNCENSGLGEWMRTHSARLDQLARDFLPSGSGFDNGTAIHRSSDAGKVLFSTSFHHMDENGFYCGWTSHKVTVRPSLIGGYTVTVSGPNRRDIREHIADTFHAMLAQLVRFDDATGRYVAADAPRAAA